MGPLAKSVKVRKYFYGLTIEINIFAFEVKFILGLKSTLLGGGWVAGISKTITNSASAEAEVEDRLSLAISNKEHFFCTDIFYFITHFQHVLTKDKA